MCTEPLPPPPTATTHRKPQQPLVAASSRQPAVAVPVQILSGNRQPAAIPPSVGRQAVSPAAQGPFVGRQSPPNKVSTINRQAITPPNSKGGRQPASTPIQMSNGGRQPASTPKRDSPATIAAKEAPGWQMFLGLKSSTVSFTSEEASKFRATRDESRTRSSVRRDKDGSGRSSKDGSSRAVLDKVPPPTRNEPTRRQESGPPPPRLKRTESRGRKRTDNPNRTGSGAETENIDPNTKRQSVDHTDRTSPRVSSDKFRNVPNNKFQREEEAVEVNGDNNPSADTKQQHSPHSLHLSRERSLKSISNWWKNSLESGPTPPGGQTNGEWTTGSTTPSPKHNHSHSDSGISSLSGRSSCMSPMSDLSSSSGSSRTSLRSSSIVSACNLPLEEEVEGEERAREGEGADYEDLCRDLLVYSPKDSRIASAISKYTFISTLWLFISL